MKTVFAAFTSILIYGGVCLLCGCAGHTGFRSGQVFDAFTGKPIECAVAHYTWGFNGILEDAECVGVGGHVESFEILTDKDGKYFFPDMTIERQDWWEWGFHPRNVIIYRDGYAAYVVDHPQIDSPVLKPIGYPDDNQIYHDKNNIVKLYPWKDGESHDRHAHWIQSEASYSPSHELLKRELEPEQKRAHEQNLNDRREAENKRKEEKKRANEQKIAWYNEAGWPVGCNFIPSTAINQLEMWQKDTYDPNTIDRELGFAEEIGFNTVRVYLHYLVWQQDPNAFKDRIDNFLGICEKHKIRVMFVLFDDCWNGNARLGKQPAPKPGVHNSGWVQCPRYAEVNDVSMEPVFEKYVTDLLKSFGKDDRVLIWDLYNEPGNSHKPKQIMPFLKKVVEWARKANPKQPMTIGVWTGGDNYDEINKFQLDNSDVISFHNYSGLEQMKNDIAKYKSYGRPVICTEYIARGAGSRFETHLPLMKKENVGAINWGLVYGKTQTIFPWGSPLNAPEPNIWHHDIFRKDGSPFDKQEIEIIKSLTK